MHYCTPQYVIRLLLYAVTVITLLSLAACSSKQQSNPDAVPPAPPAIPVTENESVETFVHYLHPANQDLRSWREMAPTVRKSLDYVKNKPQNAIAVQGGAVKITWGEMRQTLTRLLTVLPLLDRDPSLFTKHFRWVPINDGMKYTGYYEPLLHASRTKKGRYTHPLYMRPPDLSQRIARYGRYYTRAEIENKKVLAGKGLELAWVDDPVTAFFLEIQGSGRLLFDDGTTASVNYAGQNKHKYKAIGRLMFEKGLLDKPNMLNIKQWFKENPSRVREVLNWNPSYVFFRFGTGARGAMGALVDEWMSLAVDRNYVPLGAVLAFGMNMKDVGNTITPMRGIGFSQDVGGAIKRNRIDLFCGASERAEYVASKLDAKGPAWVLVAK
jgi:membrane-bound lytic murein transglycosylase A